MKYTIITLGNEERGYHRYKIRQAMSGYIETFVHCVDGRNPCALKYEEDRYGFKYLMEEWRPGELGLWYSNIHAWEKCVEDNEDLVVFEDDAVPREEFRPVLDRETPPEDYDFATYYTPLRNPFQQSFFRWDQIEQEHGNIAVRYSPKGAARILEILEDEGIEYPVDIWLYKQAKFRGLLQGYGPKSVSHVIIDHDFDVPTNIHTDERITVNT